MLGFRKDWRDTGHVFAHIAAIPIVRDLRYLRLDGIRCKGDSLSRFLTRHRTLRHIRLENFDITGSTSSQDVLRNIEESCHELINFECDQVTEHSFRVYFETLGHVTVEDYRRDLRQDEFLKDFVWARRPRKSFGRADESEDVHVRSKIGLLREDVAISDIEYHPDDPTSTYRWEDLDD